MRWSVGGSRRADRRAARHRWDSLFPAQGGGILLPDGTEGSERGPHREAGEAGVSDGGHSAAPLPASAEDGTRLLAGRRLVVSLRAAAALAVVLALGSGLWWWSSAAGEPDVRSVEAAGEGAEQGMGHWAEAGAHDADPPAAADAGPGHLDAQGGDTLVAHVAGAVAAPGVYSLPPGARYHEAIAAAGGASPDADVHRLNLAAAIEDGMRLYVPRMGEAGDPATGGAPAAAGSGATTPGAPPAAGGAAAGATAGPGTKVNLNTATAEELGALPRVGPVLAQRIVDFRTQHGRFAAPEDLDAVDGIGPKMLEALLPLVTV